MQSSISSHDDLELVKAALDKKATMNTWKFRPLGHTPYSSPHTYMWFRFASARNMKMFNETLNKFMSHGNYFNNVFRKVLNEEVQLLHIPVY